MIKLKNALLDVGNASTLAELQKSVGAASDIFNEKLKSGQITVEEYKAAMAGLTKQVQSMKGEVTKAAPAVSNLGDETGDTGDETDESTESIRAFVAEVSKVNAKTIQAADSYKILGADIKQAESSVAMLAGVQQTSTDNIVANALRNAEAMKNIATVMREEGMAKELEKAQETAAGVSAGIDSAFGGMGASISAAMGEAQTGMDAFKQQMVMFALDMIAQALSTSIANAIIGATAAGAAAGPAAPFVTPALIAQAVGTVFGAFAAIPAFADGGIVSGTTIGMMGEYAGARTNTEVIAPLDKLKSMLPSGEGGMGGEVKFRIEGKELVGILSRYDKINKFSS